MQFCEDHWAKLREAIRARGLWQFVAQGGEEAARRMQSGEFEPLLQAHNMIITRAMQYGGLEFMMSANCPVCEAVEKSPIGAGATDFRDKADIEQHWIDGPADAVLQLAQQRGLIQAH